MSRYRERALRQHLADLTGVNWIALCDLQ
ncbi:hypothetical protein PSPO01_15632 [Paraphaeosphaeria sporulosa]